MQNVFSEYTLMDKGGKRVLECSYDSWSFFCLLKVFEKWNCKKFQCFKTRVSVQLDQSRFRNTEISNISYISASTQEIVLQKKTVYNVIILGGLDTFCLHLKKEHYLMNRLFPVEPPYN